MHAQDDFFADLYLMVNNALKFHKVGTDFHALSLNIQKYIEDNIVQIQQRLSESSGSSAHPQTKQHIVGQNSEGGLLEASCVKTKPLSEKEKEDLASSVSELFKVLHLWTQLFSFSSSLSVCAQFY